MPQSLPIASAGKRERTKAANRQSILEAARRVFLQLGYEAATVRDIIRGTELASGTFYNYFRSKEEVFEALADDAARRFRPVLRDIREHAQSFEDFIGSAVRAYFDFLVAEHESGARPLAHSACFGSHDTPEIRAVYAEIRDGFADAVGRGLAPAIDPDYLAAACIGIAEEVGNAMLRRRPYDVTAAAELVTAFVLGGAARVAARRIEG
jgi:AcrR family transcriptional regulator